MALLVFADETGDHNLSKIDTKYPVFSLVMTVCEHKEYHSQIVPRFNEMKHLFWGHEGIIFRSYNIRKSLGNFNILQNQDTRELFYSEMNKVMTDCPYTLISTTIQKEKHLEKYGSNANSPYDYALKVCLERLVSYAIDRKEKEVKITAESRTKEADKNFRRVFTDITKYGTQYILAPEFAKVNFTLNFAAKDKNITGLQISDLVANPIVMKVMFPEKKYPPYDIIKSKFYRKRGNNLGFKVLP